MPGLTVDQFGKKAVAAGLFTVDELKSIWSSIPAADRPKNGDAFAALLVTQARLNEFQADELLYGSGTPLVLNQYVLLGKIGSGGMGQVFKAQHRKMKRLAAIKLLPSSLAKDEAAIKRFQREVEAAAKLAHPNIVQTYDADECHGTHYMVMEYVEGRDLSALLKERGPFAVDHAVNCILQAARGLAYAHSKGVVHRDIKPSNLLLDAEGTVKILDMGLARIDAAAEAADHQLTNTGQVMGTVDYMPPEQAANTHNADHRSDIYALGCSLHRLLTGDTMFGGTTAVEKILAHMNSPIPSLTGLRSDVPPEIDRIFQKMVAKQPEDRYQQTAQLVAELEAWRNPGMAASFAGSMSSLSENSQLRDFSKSVGGASSLTSVASATAAARAKGNVEATLTSLGHEVPTDPKSEVLAGISGQGTGLSQQSQSTKIPIRLVAGGAVCAALVIGAIVFMSRDESPNVANVPAEPAVGAGPQSPALAPHELPTSPLVPPNAIPATPQSVPLAIPDGPPGEVWQVEPSVRVKAVWFLRDSSLLYGDIGYALTNSSDGSQLKRLDWVGEKDGFNAIRSRALSPDERFLAVCAKKVDQTRFFLVSAATGELVRTMRDERGNEDFPSADGPVAFSPDGTRLFGGGPEPRSLHVWDVATGKLIKRLAVDVTLARADVGKTALFFH